MDGAGTGNTRLGGRFVVGVVRAALLTPYLPLSVTLRLEVERLLEEAAAGVDSRVGANAVESLEGELVGDLRLVGDQRLVVGLDVGDLEGQSFGILEAEAIAFALDRHSLVGEPIGPEVERFIGADAKDDRVHHPASCAAASRLRILEEGQVAARAPFLVCVEEVVDGRVVLVDGLLDE